MFTLQKFLESMEQVVPAAWAETWDNPGLQIGDLSAPVKKIAVALDITEQSVKIAEKQGCDLLVSHHPLFFQPLRSLSLHSPTGRIIARAIRGGISLISFHTNWDVSPEGVNVSLANRLELSTIEPLEKATNGSWGTGALGELSEQLDFPVFVDLVREKWGLSWVRGYPASQKTIRKVALCGGSGSSLTSLALSHQADVFITADMKYHQISSDLDSGLALCVVDHGEMESISLPALARIIKRVCGLPVQVLETRALPMSVSSNAPEVLFKSNER